MKYVLVVIIVIIAAASFVAPLKSFRLPFANSEPAPTLSFGGVESKACTEKGVWSSGFPFRINLYDECEQDQSVHTVALLINIIFWTLVAGFVFVRLSKRNS